jgi:hypothetical protein
VGRARDARVLEHDAAAGAIYANEGVAQMLFFESDEVCARRTRIAAGSTRGSARDLAADLEPRVIR